MTTLRAMVPMCLISFAAMGQIHPHFGVQVGVPITDTLTSSSFTSSDSTSASVDRYHSATKRFLVGPSFRVELTHGLGLEFDALYQRVDYDHFTLSSSTGNYLSQSFERTKGDRWQFPLLVQYGFNVARLHPFVEAGPTISRITNVAGQINTISNFVGFTNSSSRYPVSGSTGTQAGFTSGGGLDFSYHRFHLRPEVRFSRWFAQTGSASVFLAISPIISGRTAIQGASSFRTTQNEASFLLGISF